jgi:hypothetical protein
LGRGSPHPSTNHYDVEYTSVHHRAGGRGPHRARFHNARRPRTLDALERGHPRVSGIGDGSRVSSLTWALWWPLPRLCRSLHRRYFAILRAVVPEEALERTDSSRSAPPPTSVTPDRSAAVASRPIVAPGKVRRRELAGGRGQGARRADMPWAGSPTCSSHLKR